MSAAWGRARGSASAIARGAGAEIARWRSFRPAVFGIAFALHLASPGALPSTTCFLKTGFDAGVYLELGTNTDVGHIRGRDSTTGFALTNLNAMPAFQKADLGALGPIPENILFAITNMGGARGHALSMQCFRTVPGAQHNTRARYSLDFREAPRFTQAYVRYRMMLHPAYRDGLRETGGWFQVFEFKDYRLRDAAGAIDRSERVHTLHVNVKHQGDRFHYFAGWRTINPAQAIWRLENTDIPVKFGEWFTVEIFLKPGPAGTGRFLYRVDGRTVFSVEDRDIQYKDSPLHTFEIFKIYMAAPLINWMRDNGTPCQAWYDDLEYWDDMPGKER